MSWIPLHIHSQYSILDSTLSIQDIVEKGSQFGMKAIALTDFSNMFGAIDFYKACISANIKPIIGCEVMVAPDSRHEKKKKPGCPVGYPLILIAKNREGYRNLCKISSIGYLEGFYYTPRVDQEILETYSKGLICLSGPIHSRLSQCIIQDRIKDLENQLEWYLKTFGQDFYFEVQRHKMSDQNIYNEGIEKESWLYQSYLDRVKQQEKIIDQFMELSIKNGVSCVATNDTRYMFREDWKAHEILMNIQSGEPCEIIEWDSFGNQKGRSLNPKRKIVPTHELYFKSPEEIKELFNDIPAVIDSSVQIAEKCSLELDFETKFYPVFIPPHLEGKQFKENERIKEAAQFLKDLCNEGIKSRYNSECLEEVRKKYPNQDPLEVVKARLENELEIIISKGMCDYLLIVYDFIAWAKKEKIPVGPGRGSGAGSIILYLIGITNIEPLRFNLFFERFINPERISYPDIDVDICMERRAEVIEYTINKYGKDKVSQIITFGTMKAKMAIKDVGRVLNVPLSKVNNLTKLVPDDPNINLKKAIEIDSQLRSIAEEDEDVRRILEYAQKLEGSIRNTGIHAAGLIICGDVLTNHIPVCNSKGSDMLVTQYAMKPVEAVGMLKIDFLGLKTLTTIQKAVDAISDQKINWMELKLDNQETFNLLNQGKTQGVFQLESAGMQDLAKQLHIDKFEEIIAVGALYRPGPMEMIPSFINRKHGREKIEVDHPLMEEIIQETYGIMVYQEQVMQIASRLAKYSLAEGDVLRRAMGKKDKKEMSKQREKFRIGSHENEIDEKKSMEIFDKIEKFASYGFNKSHAAAYGYLSYVTAYLKANYPREWVSALLTCDMDDLSKVAKHIRECEAMGIKILSPDINEAGLEFIGTASGIRFAMSGIKGIGSGVVETILEERDKNGHFQSLFEFFKRVDTKKIGKKVAENLIWAGSFDFTGWTRQDLLSNIEPMFEQASRKQKEDEKGVLDMFENLEKDVKFSTSHSSRHEISKKDKLAKEKELLGFYLTGHPMDDFKNFIKKLKCESLHKIEELKSGGVIRTAFIIDSVTIKISKRSQKKFAILSISDGIEHFELPIWPDLYQEKYNLFIENQILYAILHVEHDDNNIRLNCHTIEDLTNLDEQKIKEFDSIYVQAQKGVKHQSKRKKKKMEVNKKVTINSNKLYLQIDADLVKLSEIIRLKQTFYKFPGDIPVKIKFFSAQQTVGDLDIESKWGVGYNNALKGELEQLSFIQSFSFET